VLDVLYREAERHEKALVAELTGCDDLLDQWSP
jgi:hypothetical protein